jgi:hypothetical protein
VYLNREAFVHGMPFHLLDIIGSSGYKHQSVKNEEADA